MTLTVPHSCIHSLLSQTLCCRSCRSNPDDTLENAELLGMNVYLHCDGSATSPDGLPGFEALLADFQSYETSVPVLVCQRSFKIIPVLVVEPQSLQSSI